MKSQVLWILFVLLTSLHLTTIRSIKTFDEIGDISIRESQSFERFMEQHKVCGALIPVAKTCDRAMETVDDYCYSQMHLSILYCEKRFQDGIDNCNRVGRAISRRCLREVGYISEKCGRAFDFLKHICEMESDYQSVMCDQLIKKNERNCNKFKAQTFYGCRRVYSSYGDACKSPVRDNYGATVKFSKLKEIFLELNNKLKWINVDLTAGTKLNRTNASSQSVELSDKLGLFRFKPKTNKPSDQNHKMDFIF